MNSNNDNDNNDGWSIAGSRHKIKNKIKRNKQKIQLKQKKQKEKLIAHRIKKEQEFKDKQKEEWRKKRIALIKEKEFLEYKSRKILPKFAKAIQTERNKINLSRKDLALKLMISENELADYENGSKCPSSQTVVKLRKFFNNLPKKYFLIE